MLSRCVGFVADKHLVCAYRIFVRHYGVLTFRLITVILVRAVLFRADIVCDAVDSVCFAAN
jgi:hypothetical protein